MADPFDTLKAALADRYNLERELGAGGMATVYLAHDVRHNRHVAIKVLRPELAAFIGAERFLKEIETTANLQHPHILPLFDSGRVDGTVFYVMPYVQGQSLRNRLTREKQLPRAIDGGKDHFVHATKMVKQRRVRDFHFAGDLGGGQPAEASLRDDLQDRVRDIASAFFCALAFSRDALRAGDHGANLVTTK